MRDSEKYGGGEEDNQSSFWIYMSLDIFVLVFFELCRNPICIIDMSTTHPQPYN